jgi:uncharacterized repeat protein (TIGR01451 family)
MSSYTGDMYRGKNCKRFATWSLCMMAGAVAAQEASSALAIKAIAEVEIHATVEGRETTKLAPANRVVSGDQLIYTLQVRNTRAAAAPDPVVTYPIPTHMIYVADSAVGPSAEVSYSVDGGRSFDRPENLLPAVAADYTHIRWRMIHTLKGNSVAFLRFRALVK